MLDLGFQADTIPNLSSCLQANIFEALYKSSLRSVFRRIRILEFAAKCNSGFKIHCLLLIFATYYVNFLFHQWITGRKSFSFNIKDFPRELPLFWAGVAQGAGRMLARLTRCPALAELQVWWQLLADGMRLLPKQVPRSSL